ncbi:MAG: dethiobiotin synthase, partial [Perlucidibaca sp.]
MPAYFVTGTDTDIGKTLVATALLAAARARGVTTLGLKPVAAGCHDSPEGLRNEDALALQSGSTLMPLPYQEVNPVALPAACSPHIAAREAGRRVTVSQLAGYCRYSLSRRAGLTLIEGAGGWRVPLNDRESLSLLARELQHPVIHVIGKRQGGLNNARRTTQAQKRDWLK